MKSFLLAAVLLTSLLTSARAQMGADEQYIAIYGVIQQAETQISAGEPQQALASLKVAQAQLQKFQKLFPNWNPGIINYRLDSVSQKIGTLQAQVTATSTVVPPASATNGMSAAQAAKASAQEDSLRAENQTLQAKLKEALASQPAAVDAGELAQAQEKIRSLMKANDLLEAEKRRWRRANPADRTQTKFQACASNWPMRPASIRRSIRARKNSRRKMRRCKKTCNPPAAKIRPRWRRCAVKTTV